MNRRGDILFISRDDFDTFLDRLAREMRVYEPVPRESRDETTTYSYGLHESGRGFCFPGIRTEEPLKLFQFMGRGVVAAYPDGDAALWEDTPSVAVVGVAACDLGALRSLDVIFLQEEWTDPFYRTRRERTIIIGADCENPRDTCQCTLAGIHPFAETGYDLNLGRTENGFLVDIGSDRGAEVVSRHGDIFGEPEQADISERDRKRTETEQAVENINAPFALSVERRELLDRMRDSELWYEHVSTCVGCGACLFACPTCHCFLLSDHVAGEGAFTRLQAWDACSYGGYSRMAGGSSPRLGLMERFRHRYLHKFSYYPANFGFEACTGCGRCIAGCMGRIDMRTVFSSLDGQTDTVESSHG